jgi:hypothetical protein
LDILDYGVEAGAEFIVSSDLLYDFIKNRHPEAKLIASEVKSLYEMEKGNEIDFYKRIYDKYERITLSPQYVKDGFLRDFEKYEDVSKFEVIVNDNCLIACDRFKEHNEAVENYEREGAVYVDYYKHCPKNMMSIKEGVLDTLILSEYEINNLVENFSIKHLRLKGFGFQPIIWPEILSSYIFNTIGEFQNVALEIDAAMSNITYVQ